MLKKIATAAMAAPKCALAGSDPYLVELQAVSRNSRRSSHALFIILLAFIAVLLFWSAFASLDEVVRGSGKVIPSSEVKRIQNYEGGIIQAILVRAGQQVSKGQEIIRLDPTQMTSRFREIQSAYLDQMATIARLEAEVAGSAEIKFPAEVVEKKPHLVEAQRQLMESRNASRQSALTILIRDMEQKKQELRGMQSKLEYQQKNYVLLTREVDMLQDMVSRGAASSMDLLKSQRQVTELSGQIAESRLAIPRLIAALDAGAHRIEEEKEKQRTEIYKELNAVRMDFEGKKEKLPALEDQMDRTSVRSPVDGTIKQVFVTTIGEAVSPGKEIVEIVPKEDTLLIEARVNPQDIAFIRPDQKASVKITAYDYSIYGSMPGIVEHISADAITDEQQKAHYYLIKVRTNSATLHATTGEELPIIPGMVAEVDILTGKKTVLEYLLRPIIKTKDSAMRER